MVTQRFLDNWNIIEDEQIGKYLGSLVVNLETKDIYNSIHETRVRILQSPNNLGLYRTVISKDSYSLKNNKLVEDKKQEYKTIYSGNSLSKAINSFKEIIDKKIKENRVHNIFNRN
ncbi:MAG: hypothetical protein AABX44_02095 [Nanoarchaeota archaeon]